MDNQHLSKYTPDRQGQYYVLDTTVDPNTTAQIPAMNGRVGDKMRRVMIAFVDDGNPHDLTNETIELRCQDAAGKVHSANKVINNSSPTGGLITFGVPADFYENAGEVQHAYFVLTGKDAAGDDQQVSTVNIDFTVVESGIDMTLLNGGN
ncbi:BppU family phage baseplate upper protein [Limosilactobacillus antri]|uniref:BppU family phage baseplate upper protein n=1 Tax=Limosilactobacillus antri TaxID=227943 RepID=UPI001F5A4676|nr:BppU family phage baseplate upper protein [Limosilactobacillus antri]